MENIRRYMYFEVMINHCQTYHCVLFHFILKECSVDRGFLSLWFVCHALLLLAPHLFFVYLRFIVATAKQSTTGITFVRLLSLVLAFAGATMGRRYYFLHSVSRPWLEPRTSCTSKALNHYRRISACNIMLPTISGKKCTQNSTKHGSMQCLRVFSDAVFEPWVGVLLMVRGFKMSSGIWTRVWHAKRTWINTLVAHDVGARQQVTIWSLDNFVTILLNATLNHNKY